jgi:hypothetical protein
MKNNTLLTGSGMYELIVLINPLKPPSICTPIRKIRMNGSPNRAPNKLVNIASGASNIHSSGRNTSEQFIVLEYELYI